VFVDQTIGRGRWQPLSCGIISGVIAAVLGSRTSFFPPPITHVYIPVIATAIVTAVTCRKSDWAAVIALRTDPFHLSPKQNITSVAIGLAVAVIGAYSKIGRPILLGLDYDVRGHTPAEHQEIAVTGAILGFLVGAGIAATIIAGIARRQRTRHDS
jgi:hypothetical protein